MADRIDVAVVGGGAAGIAAARRLAGYGRSVLIVEALERLGGRARTVVAGGLPLDLGCGWLHSGDRNPLAALADATGVTVDRSDAAWGEQLRGIGFSPEDQRAAWAAYRRLGERLRRDPPASDRAGDAMPPGDRWRGFVDMISSVVNGAELDRISARDFLAYDDAATDANWRLPGGYGTFVAGLGDGIPAALSTAVSAITVGADVALETDRGTLRARAAVVAVPTSVLAAGTIRFAPALDDHLHAAACLPLGLADKVFLSLADPEAVPAESHLLGRHDRAETGSYYLRPFGRPVVECYFAGAWARALEDAGPEAAVAFAVEELGGLLGAGFARGLGTVAISRWAHEPTIRGAYSHALPGHAGARAVLATPPSPRLAFAGEACSPEDFSTAHGAWQSGLAAADGIERGLAEAA